ncbi:hypothetical protein JD844_019998, partial [Phrynosoma platyrhinos]
EPPISLPAAKEEAPPLLPPSGAEESPNPSLKEEEEKEEEKEEEEREGSEEKPEGDQRSPQGEEEKEGKETGTGEEEEEEEKRTQKPLPVEDGEQPRDGEEKEEEEEDEISFSDPESFVDDIEDEDLAKPLITDLKEPEESLMQTPPGSPLVLSHTLPELLSKDTVQVELIPEKKGLFLKHVEYEVTSKRFRCSVYRRYNDFVVFHEMLLQKFPYRMVPALPPKRMLGADREFIETRRRALKRFVNLVARHPPFSEDVLLKLFLSFSGSDVQNKLRELVQGVGDEFMTCKLATQAKDFLPADIQVQFAASRELIRNIYNSFYKLRDRAERIASRAIDNASDLLMFGKELSALGSDTTPLPSWAALNNSAWGSLKQALKGLSVEFALLADKAVQQGKQEENDVVEKLNLFLDLLQSYKDLCERHEKGVLHKHQRALHKYSMMKRQMMSATVQNKEPESVEQLESRIVEMSKVWNELKPKLSCLFIGSSNMQALPLSPQDGNLFSS